MPPSSTTTTVSYGARYKVHETVDIAAAYRNKSNTSSSNNTSNNRSLHYQDPLLCHKALTLLMMNTINSDEEKVEQNQNDEDNNNNNNNSILNSPSSSARRNQRGGQSRGITLPVVDHMKLLQQVASNRGSFSQFLRTSAGGCLPSSKQQHHQYQDKSNNNHDKNNSSSSYYFDPIHQSNSSGPARFSEQILFDAHLKDKLGKRGPDLGQTASQRRRDEILKKNR